MSSPLSSQTRDFPINWRTGLSSHLPDLNTFAHAHRHIPTTRETARLAELVYNQTGSNHMAQKKGKETSRLQLEHQLNLKGLLEDGQAPSGSQRSLKIASAVLRKRRNSEQKIEEKLSTEGDDDDDDDDEGEEGWSDEMEIEDDDDDDRNQKVIYTKNNGRKMVF